jgi:hypothetical protein
MGRLGPPSGRHCIVGCVNNVDSVGHQSRHSFVIHRISFLFASEAISAGRGLPRELPELLVGIFLQMAQHNGERAALLKSAKRHESWRVMELR